MENDLTQTPRRILLFREFEFLAFPEHTGVILAKLEDLRLGENLVIRPSWRLLLRNSRDLGVFGVSDENWLTVTGVLAENTHGELVRKGRETARVERILMAADGSGERLGTVVGTHALGGESLSICAGQGGVHPLGNRQFLRGAPPWTRRGTSCLPSCRGVSRFRPMKEVVSGTLAIASLGWITVEGMLSGNPVLIIAGLLISVFVFTVLGCLPISNSRVNSLGFVVSVLIFVLGLVLAVMSFAAGNYVMGVIKLLFFLAMLASNLGIYLKEKPKFANESHGH